VSELANLHHDTRMPFVGASAFAHKGGVHVHAIMKHSRTYEHIPPEAVGNRRRVLVSELSGLSNLLYKYRELNLNLESEESRRLLAELKELEYQGYQFEGAEGSFELLLRRANEGYRLPFQLENLRVLVELRAGEQAYSEAIIKLRVNDEVVHTAAEGNGPVNALDNALRKALEQFYPAVREMQLTDYKVRVLNGEQGTEAVVRVLIETGDGERSWGTVGVSTNIIEASWQALVDSIAYGLLKRGMGGSA
jgi:2-isopropylmalate synthase